MKLFLHFTPLVLSILIPPASMAEAVIDFGVVAPTAGVISYAGGVTPMIGSGIQVDNVVGIGTPSQNFVARNCLSCVLNFATGNLLSSGANLWSFGGGGNLTLTGTVDLNGDGLVGTGDATGVLMSGYFSAASVSVQNLVFRVAAASFSSVLSTALTNFYGTDPSPFTYQSGLNVSFMSSAIPPAGFTSGPLLSGDVVAATPEPASLFLLVTVLVASGILFRRRFAKL
jgi:hypothetical protein